VYLPRLFLIRAAIARGRGPSAVAHATARRAVAEARAQQAPWFELIALLELANATARRPKIGTRLPLHGRAGSRSARRAWSPMRKPSSESFSRLESHDTP